MLRALLDELRRRLRRRQNPGGPAVLRAIREPQAPLPAALARRLRDLPRREILCRDLDRQGLELARGELADPRAAALRLHLEGCRRCSRVFAVLAVATGEPPRPLPGRLTFRLTSLARPRTAAAALPRFLRDSRYAAAASAVAAVLLTTAAGGDPLAVASRAAGAASSRVREHGPILPVLREEPLHRARTWVEALGEQLQRDAAAAWKAELARGRQCSGRIQETLRRQGADLEAEARGLVRRAPEMGSWIRTALAGARPGASTTPPSAPQGTGGETPDPRPEIPQKP